MLFEEELSASNKFPDHGYDRDVEISKTEVLWNESGDSSDSQKDFDSEASEEFFSSDNSFMKKYIEDNDVFSRTLRTKFKEPCSFKDSIEDKKQHVPAMSRKIHEINYKTTNKKARVENIVATIKDRPAENLSDNISTCCGSEFGDNAVDNGASNVTSPNVSSYNETEVQPIQVSPNIKDKNLQLKSNNNHPDMDGDVLPPKRGRFVSELDNDLVSVSNSQQTMKQQHCDDFIKRFAINANRSTVFTHELLTISLKNELLPKLERVIEDTAKSVINEMKHHFSKGAVSYFNSMNKETNAAHFCDKNLAEKPSVIEEQHQASTLKDQFFTPTNGIQSPTINEAAVKPMIHSPVSSLWNNSAKQPLSKPSEEGHILKNADLLALSGNKTHKDTNKRDGTFPPVKLNTSFLSHNSSSSASFLPINTTLDASFLIKDAISDASVLPKDFRGPYKSPPALLAPCYFSSTPGPKIPSTLNQSHDWTCCSKDIHIGVPMPQSYINSFPSLKRSSLLTPSPYNSHPVSSFTKSNDRPHQEIPFVGNQQPKSDEWYGQLHGQRDYAPSLPRAVRKRVPRNYFSRMEYMSQGMNHCNGHNFFHSMQSILTPFHLKKAKLMFFYTRYPSSNTIKVHFSDIHQSRSTNSQLVKWFSNFREFYYIQIEKYTRQALSDGVKEIDQLEVTRNSDLFRALDHHFNKDNNFDVPEEFLTVVLKSLQEFFHAIQNKKDRDPSWKKEIYKIICKLDEEIPKDFLSLKAFQV